MCRNHVYPNGDLIMNIVTDKTIVIAGGTGSLGRTMTKRLVSGAAGKPKKIIIFSRDEAKQHFMRMDYQNAARAHGETGGNDYRQLLEFRIGDVRDYHAVCSVVRNADIVINAAALKQVPSCEYFPFEAVATNVIGAENIVRAIEENNAQIGRAHV